MIRATYSPTPQAGTAWFDGHLLLVVIAIPFVSWLIVSAINGVLANRHKAKR